MMENLISGLTDPTAYAHPVKQLESLQTYTSLILLTVDFAYKIKKPVDFGFLNYTTLEARHQYCQQELRLNQALAAGIYLDVVPVYQSALTDKPSLVGPGEVIDYALKMKQFPTDNLLSDVIEQHRDDYPLIDTIAKQIAKFHLESEKASAETPFGTVESVYAPVQENFDQAKPLLTAERDLNQLATLSAWAESTWQRLKPLMASRKQSGLIRACHGDLHLGNMTLIDGKPLIFDCIEFNEYFRWLDPMADIGFLMMDLLFRGYPHLASRFLNQYLELTGDYEGLHLLKFYIAYRAMVRAKIQLFQRGQQASQAQNDALLDNYRQYALLAERMATTEPLSLTMMNGVSGSGKSTIALEMVSALQMIRLRSDVERKRLFTTRTPEELYSDAAHQKTYERLFALAKTCIEAGFSPIIDATNLTVTHRQRFAKLAESLQVKFLIVACEADKPFLEYALNQRQHDKNNVSDATLEVIESQLQHRQPLTAEEHQHCVMLTMHKGSNFNQMIKSIAEGLKQRA